MDRIKNTELFLASSSPRRKELLAKLGIPFKVAAFDAGEKVPDGMTAESAVEYLACLKARCAAERVNGIVIGADTVVEKDGHIMGKPDGKDDAFRMLSTLSGSVHNVHTGVCVLETESGRCICGHETTRVFFDELTPDEIKPEISKATIANEMVPVVCGTSYRNKGVQKLLDAIIDYMPAPTDI